MNGLRRNDDQSELSSWYQKTKSNTKIKFYKNGKTNILRY